MPNRPWGTGRTGAGSLRRPALLATVCVGFFMVILDTTIVNVAVPAIQAGLHGSVTDLQWVVNGYTLVLAALLLSAGSLSDRAGARLAFCAGLGTFAVGSGLCAVAPGLGLLIAARLLQGVGASLLLPASLALIAHGFPGARERARAVGMYAAVGGAATAAGPVVGGVLIHLAGWRSIFAVNVPLGVLGVLMAARFLPQPSRQHRGFDLAGQVLGIAALGLLTAGLTEVGAFGWHSAPVLAAIVAALTLGACFVAIERRAVSPMLPLSLFSSRTFSGATASGLLLNFGIYGQVFVLSLYFQHVRHLSALATGFALLPFAGMTVFGPVLVGRLTARVGPRRPMIAGQALAAAGSALLASSGSSTAYARLAIGLVLLGCGFALTMPSLTAAIIASAPRTDAGIASGVLNASRQVGGAIGVALLGSLVAGSLGLVGGVHVALGIVTATFMLGATLAAVFVREDPRGAPRTETRKPHPALAPVEQR